MDQASAGESTHVPFVLYHGTSSHHLANFRPGNLLSHWPYKREALKLYRQVWMELRRIGHTPDWWQERVLTQESGFANWQHGQLYVTPSKVSAVRYASGGAAHGGELLQLCRNAIDELAKFDQSEADKLLNDARRVGSFLKETGVPILIEFENVRVRGLSAERSSDSLDSRLAELVKMNVRKREHLGQQINFRLAPGFGVVGRVFEVEIDDIDNPLSNFQLKEIVDSELWSSN